MTGNIRPITSNTRGKVYRYGKCQNNPYQGERGKVFMHFYRKHVAMDQVPFFCSICKFVTTSQLELEKHVEAYVYPAHKATIKAMLANKEEVMEESLFQNIKCYVITETDVVRPSREKSDQIFLSRKRADLVSLAASIAGISGEPLEDIIPDMLGNASLPSPSISV